MFDLNPAHLHLLVNHLPVEGSIVALLLLVWSLVRKSAELKRTALIACVVTGVAAFAADYTGGGASRVVRDIPGVERVDIKEHSDAADWARNSSYLLAAVAVVGLYITWRKQDSAQATSDPVGYSTHHKEPPAWVMIASLIIALWTVSVMARTAYLGGVIRHPEIEPGFKPPATLDSTQYDRSSAVQPAFHMLG